MEGGELFQRIQDRQDGAFTERGKKLFRYRKNSKTRLSLDSNLKSSNK